MAEREERMGASLLTIAQEFKEAEAMFNDKIWEHPLLSENEEAFRWMDKLKLPSDYTEAHGLKEANRGLITMRDEAWSEYQRSSLPAQYHHDRWLEYATRTVTLYLEALEEFKKKAESEEFDDTWEPADSDPWFEQKESNRQNMAEIVDHAKSHYVNEVWEHHLLSEDEDTFGWANNLTDGYHVRKWRIEARSAVTLKDEAWGRLGALSATLIRSQEVGGIFNGMDLLYNQIWKISLHQIKSSRSLKKRPPIMMRSTRYVLGLGFILPSRPKLFVK